MKATRRTVMEYYRSQRKPALFCRINRDYLTRFIQLNRLMSILKSADGLSDIQIAILNRQNNRPTKRNPKRFSEDVAVELIEMLRNSDEREQLSVIDCLRPIQRKHLARVDGKEGGLLKIDVKQRKTQQDRSLLLKLIDFIDNEKPTSAVVDQMCSKLRENGLDIFGASMDRDVACWIWCRPQNVLKQLYLKTTCRSLEDFTELLRILTDDYLFKLNVDTETLKKTTVRLSTSLIFASRLDIKNDAFEVTGITKLRNDIYVLCYSPVVYGSTIYVFEDRNQFRLKMEMKIDEIKFPRDIVSSEKEHCLYINELIDCCVWKVKEVIQENRQTKHKAIRWLKFEENLWLWTLSVSKDGQLLMINRWPPAVRVYGPDAELLLSVQLPKGIYWPQHAIETFVGNFIVLNSRTEMRAGAHTSTLPDMWVLSELSKDGKTIVRQFMPQNDEQKLRDPHYISICSRNRVIVADTGNNRVVLLDFDLKWNRILIQTEERQGGKGGVDQLLSPSRVFYDDETKFFYVGGKSKEGEPAVYLYILF